jgi:ABC-2 type transport system ATP-binding protein
MADAATHRDEAVAVTEGLVKSFGGTRVLDDIDLVVPHATIVGLIGPSGCGKTTLVRQLLGLAEPNEGRVRVFGEDPVDFTRQMRSRLGYMPQHPVLFPTLSVWGNLTFVSSVYGMKLRGRRRRLFGLLDLVELRADRRKQLANCSGGMQRRLSLAATLVHEPELLFLDEPTAGVDPILRARFWEHFRKLRDGGATIVIPTQYVSEAAMCDLVAVMSAGRLLTVSPPDELRAFAYGGDVLLYAIDADLRRADLERVAATSGVRRVGRTDDGLRVVVGDDERDAPAVEAALAGLGVMATRQRFEPNYEDLFVTIVERDRAQREPKAA